MSDKKKVRPGRCLCGAVKYRAIGEPFWVGYCHCHSCRRATGAPVVVFAGYKKDQVEFSGRQRKLFSSSRGVFRSFCGHCGTPLTWEGRSNLPERGQIIEFYISTFDNPVDLEPTNHVWYPEHISWLEVDDDLLRYRGFDFNSDIVGKEVHELKNQFNQKQ